MAMTRVTDDTLDGRRTTRGVLLLMGLVGIVITLLVPHGAVPSRAVLEPSPERPSRSGIGDPYWPRDGNGGYDVKRYDIDVRYQFQRRRLSGTTRVLLVPRRDLGAFNLDFLLPVTRVRVDGRRVPFHQDPHELVIDPPRPLPAARRVKVAVTYAGRPGRHRYADARGWLANDREVLVQGQPHIAPWWFPSNDHPRDKARMAISVTVPKGNQVIANGWPSGRSIRDGLVTHRWKARDPMAPYLAFFAAGRFTVRRGVAHGIPWLTAVSRGLGERDHRDAMALMRTTPELTAWLETQLGPYPFGSTGGVVTSLPSYYALENQTRPTFPRTGADTYDLVVHELAHQWFGDAVSLTSWRDIWLNEGFATFMEHRYAETHGGQAADEWLLDMYDTDFPGFWDFSITRPGRENVFAQQVYDRGAMTVQALRNVVGEDTFWQILRRWTTRYEGRDASTADFRRLAARVSDRDLEEFFDAWLVRRVRPPFTSDYGLGE